MTAPAITMPKNSEINQKITQLSSMKSSTFLIEIQKYNGLTTLNGETITSDCTLTESVGEKTFYSIKFQHKKITFVNSNFGYRKVYYQKFGECLRITNDIKHLDVKKFNKSGIVSIIAFGYLVPDVSLYDGIHCLQPRAILSYNPDEDVINIKYKKIETVKKSVTSINDLKTLLKIESEKYSFLMSGGRDSLVIGCINKDKNKKTFSFKLKNFRPDEDDYEKIRRYQDLIKGNNHLVEVEATDKELLESYKRSTEEAFDHVHAGRWKYDYFLKKISKNQPEKLCLVNQQTADTIISLNLPGNDLVSRIRRAAFFGRSEHRVVKHILKKLAPLMFFLFKNRRNYITGLMNAHSDSEYYAGYILNDIPFPGIEPEKFAFLSSILGIESVQEVYCKVSSFFDYKITQYKHSQSHLMMVDICLSTFIWGMDMRGLRESCHRYGHDSKFIFMDDSIISTILNLPYKYISPMSRYKNALEIIEHQYTDDIYLHRGTNKRKMDNNHSSFEKLIIDGCVGDYWRGVISDETFKKFVDYLINEFQINVLDLKLTEKNFNYWDRVISLYTWYKLYIHK